MPRPEIGRWRLLRSILNSSVVVSLSLPIFLQYRGGRWVEGRELDPTLRRMFGAIVERTFMQTLGVYEPGVTEYITDVLTDFVHFRQVYKIKDLQGKPLDGVADMLLQADVRLFANSYNREREVHRHIGDFTKIWAGVYPESLPALQSRWRKDQMVDYVRQGKSRYAIASSFDYGDYLEETNKHKQKTNNNKHNQNKHNHNRVEL